MMNFRHTVRAIWDAGNRWARLAIIVIAFWPITVVLAAFVGQPAVTATVALLPLGAIVFGLVASMDPLVIAAIGVVWPAFLRTTALIIGTELAIGVYFATIPVANDRGLIPLTLLVLLAIVFLTLSGKKMRWVRLIAAILFVIFVALTGVFVLGGREKTREQMEKVVEEINKPRPPRPPQPVATPAAPAPPASANCNPRDPQLRHRPAGLRRRAPPRGQPLPEG